MDQLSLVNLVVAFAAGAVSFLSPCMLPLVPGYLAVVAGSSEESEDPSLILRRRIRGALVFVAGFTTIFVLLGLGAGFLGGALISSRRTIEIVGGVLIALLGLGMISERLLPPSFRTRRGVELRAPNPGFGGIFVFGVIFGAAWSPCIGPTLGAILTLAAAGGSAISGAILLAVFALGLGLPFIGLAAGAGWLESSVGSVRRHIRTIQLVGGWALIVFGIALAAGWVGAWSSRLAGIPGLEF